MRPSVLRRRRALFTLATCSGLILTAWLGGLAARAAQGPVYVKRGSVHCVENDGYLYTFDPVWRLESLRKADPATGAFTTVADPERLARLRSALLERLGVGGLDRIGSEGQAERAALAALGYI